MTTLCSGKGPALDLHYIYPFPVAAAASALLDPGVVWCIANHRVISELYEYWPVGSQKKSEAALLQLGDEDYEGMLLVQRC